MVGMVADAKGTLNDDRYPLGGPHVATKAMRFRPTSQQGRDLRSLLGGQLGWAPQVRTAPQPFDALLAGALEPLTHGGATDPQGGRDVFLPPPLLVQLPGALTSPFASVAGFLCCTHSPQRLQDLDLYAEISKRSHR
jgi:hypothetical protein